MPYQILYLFHSPQGSLAEIKRLDLPHDTPKDRVYHWLWINDAAVTTLRFQSMSTTPNQTRSFAQGELSFDGLRGEMRWSDGRTIALTTAPANELTPTQRHLVQQHLA